MSTLVKKLEGPDAREVSEWETRFKDCVEARQNHEDQWYMNMAFHQGRQWATWKKTTTNGNRLIDPPAPRNRVRLVTNKVKSYIRKEHAKLTKEEPIWYVVPNTSEPDDVSAARAAESISEYILRQAKFKAVRRRATLWTCLTGVGFLKATCPSIDADIVAESITPFHIFVPDLQEETLEGQPYIIHARGLSTETVQRFWGVDVEGDISAGGATLEQKFFSALGIRPENASSRKLVYVKEIWVPPNKMPDYPMGAMLVIAGGKIIYRYEEAPTAPVGNMGAIPEESTNIFQFDPKARQKKSAYPYEHGKFPFVKFEHIPSGSFYPYSIIMDLISPQREYNKTRSQMVEMKNRTAKPPMLYPKGAINPKMVTGEPGQMIGFAPGFRKEDIGYLPPPEFPAYGQNELPILHADMDEIASQSDISRGAAPTGVQASAAISYLNEQNDSTLYITIASISDAIEEFGGQCLSLAHQYWTDAKTIKVVSPNYSQDAQVFKIADVNGNMDLRIESGSIMPQSLAGKQAFMMNLVSIGFPLEKALRYMGMNETQRMYDELQVDSRQAQRENYLMKTQTVDKPVDPMYQQQVPVGGQKVLNPEISGLPPVSTNPQMPATVTQPNVMAFPVNPYDNHEIHMYEHGLFMKMNEFENLDPTIKSVMLAHWLLHQQTMEIDVARATQFTGPEQNQPGKPAPTPNPGQPNGGVPSKNSG